jgi:hypothetical protein
VSRLVAHCHLGLRNLYRRTGKREQAQEHVTIATVIYRQMEMKFWLEKGEENTNWEARDPTSAEGHSTSVGAVR